MNPCASQPGTTARAFLERTRRLTLSKYAGRTILTIVSLGIASTILGADLVSTPTFVPKRRSHQLIDGFGVNIDLPREPHMPWTKTWAPIFDSGVKWVRIGQYENSSEKTSWDWVEQVRGVYHVHIDVDEAVRSLTDNAVEIELQLQYSNSLYPEDPSQRPARSVPPAVNIGQDDEPVPPIFLPPKTEEQIAGFLGYARYMVGHFQSRIKHWEFWNEPNIGYWRPFPTTRAQKAEKARWYGRVLSQVADAIKKVDPTAQVVSAGLSGPDFLFASNALSQCAAKVDVVAYHPYPGGPFGGNRFPEEIDSSYGATVFRERVRSISGVRNEVVFWANEWNISPEGENCNESVQAKYMTRFLIGSLAQHVKGFIWCLIPSVDGNEANQMGMINGDVPATPFKPREALRAFEVSQALFGQTERDLMVYPTLYAPTRYDHGETRSYCFRDRVNGKRIYAYWLAIYSEPADNFQAPQVDFKIQDAELLHPILIDVRTGRIEPLAWKDEAKKILSVPLKDSVMAVADASYIDWQEVPDSPGALTAKLASGDALLAWQATPKGTTQELEVSKDQRSWQPIATLPYSEASFTYPLTSPGHYTFRIRTKNSGGFSAWSNPAWVDRPDIGVLPAVPPSNLP